MTHTGARVKVWCLHIHAGASLFLYLTLFLRVYISFLISLSSCISLFLYIFSYISLSLSLFLYLFSLYLSLFSYFPVTQRAYQLGGLYLTAMYVDDNTDELPVVVVTHPTTGVTTLVPLADAPGARETASPARPKP